MFDHVVIFLLIFIFLMDYISASPPCRANGRFSDEQCGSLFRPPLKPRNYSRGGEQLFEDLLFHYNRNVRPIKNASDVLVVQFSSYLIRIIDLNEKTQQLTTNLWLEIRWTDAKLTWDPKKYDNIRKLNMPAEFIWKPDIVLYTNADGEPHITINVDTMVYFDGTVVWKPPAIYRSFCEIDVKLFPYDDQRCEMKFGDWTYDGYQVDLQQHPLGNVVRQNSDGFDVYYLEKGMDLSYFQESAQWDLIKLFSEKQSKIYSTCCGADKYTDVTFHFVLRRKGLFFSAFLVVPSVLIALLTTFVFYLPSCSMKKMTLATNILVALMVFFTALIDLVPPNSVVVPLLMKYLLFTMLLVSASIAVNVLILNVHYRGAGTHHMPNWVRAVLLQTAPRYLCMKVPNWHVIDPEVLHVKRKIRCSVFYANRDSIEDELCSDAPYVPDCDLLEQLEEETALTEIVKEQGMCQSVMRRVVHHVNVIAELFSRMEDDGQISSDWSYVGLVIDRIFLWIFTLGNLLGTVSIFYEALSIFDGATPLPIPQYATKPLGGDTYSWALENATQSANVT